MSDYVKYIFYSDEKLLVTLEKLDGYVLAHVSIFSPDKKTIKRLLEIWVEILARAYWQGYEEIYTYTKDERMLKIVKGGEIIGEYERNGEIFKVVKWDLK